jgi:HlyD family secretion protein
MDIPRHGVAEKRRRRQIVLVALGVVLVALVTWGLSRLEPAAPGVDRSVVWIEAVKRGDIPRQVRGPGTLVPEEIRWIVAETQAQVESRLVLPGALVTVDTVILELSNPELEQATQDALLALSAAKAELADLGVQLESELLNQRANAAAVESEYKQALLQAEADERLGIEGLKPELEVKKSRLRAAELENRDRIEKERLAFGVKSVAARLASQRARLEQAEALYALRQRQLDALTVRAEIDGVLQQVPVDVGEQVAPGHKLARVAQPERLKAELRIAETQAKDIQIGQPAEIDTRNGIVEGRVSRVDPAVQNGTVTVDVQLVAELPKGARPDLSVDGTILLELLEDVLYVGRPTYGQPHSTVGLFRLDRDSDLARRVQVRLGRSSVNTIEIIQGLEVGDQVILSDTSQWDAYDRIRLNRGGGIGSLFYPRRHSGMIWSLEEPS